MIQTKSIPMIFITNICTLFNAVNAILAVAIFSVGSYKNMLFMGVVLSNLAIGIIQEIRAKRTLDRLSLLHATKATVLRDGVEFVIPLEEIRVGDLLVLERGQQLPADCILVEGFCDMDESFLTGESDAIEKRIGDQLLSGSFVVSGRCIARAEQIGEDTYLASISKEAKYYKKIKK